MSDPGTLTDEAREAILEPARDYLEGWITADSERMRRCLHPELVKRTVRLDDHGRPFIATLSRDEMVRYTGDGDGLDAAGPADYQIVDAHGDIAIVIVRSVPYVDYLQVARLGDRWQIVNVLWQPRDV